MQERDPHARLYSALLELYNGELPGAIPRRWERFADVAILPAGAFRGGRFMRYSSKGLGKGPLVIGDTPGGSLK